MNGEGSPAREGERVPFRATVMASLLLHTALFLVPAGVWRQLPGLGPRGGDGPGGGRPLVVAFYDPGPLGEKPVLGPEAAVEPPPSEPVPSEPTPRTATPPVEIPSPPSSADPEAGSAEGTAGGSRRGEGVPGAPGVGDVPGFEEDGDEGFHPPRLLTGALPIDPEEIEDLDVPREIPVRIRVGQDGRVLRIEPLQTDLPEVVREAIVRSARAMRFVPARQGKDAVESWFAMTFIYDPGS
jgi:hypothetical protein